MARRYRRIQRLSFTLQILFNRSSSTFSPITTKKIHSGRIPSNDRDYLVFLAAILLGLIIPICILCCPSTIKKVGL